ncbi:CPBP family intramembrane glutamic endopeptidase [Lactiplantibacillus mudanjiangensis]|uniref:CPBP family intramembrane glutamic endopeptidase n=1 Tax=Lactiplantibacillus mudanjiangensis TaxID=1296538 RepID=UPI0021F06D84
MEELVFRGVLTTLFWRQNWLKVLLSGLVFGSLHTTNTIPSFLIYFTMGLVISRCLSVDWKITDFDWVTFFD